ncbi:MAG: hypothetical protein ACOH5I_26710 [Oligoflexus sp.]
MEKYTPISFRLDRAEMEVFERNFGKSGHGNRTKFIKSCVLGETSNSMPSDELSELRSVMKKLVDFALKSDERLSKIEAHFEELTDSLGKLLNEGDSE